MRTGIPFRRAELVRAAAIRTPVRNDRDAIRTGSAAREILPQVPAPTSPLGDLQAQIMSALWRLGSGTVEEVRSELPARYRGAYNTVQTVLNRLADRGLVSRSKRGSAFEYTPTWSESEYLSRSIATTLAGASSGARQAALAELIGGLDQRELKRLQKLARKLEGRSRNP